MGIKTTITASIMLATAALSLPAMAEWQVTSSEEAHSAGLGYTDGTAVGVTFLGSCDQAYLGVFDSYTVTGALIVDGQLYPVKSPVTIRGRLTVFALSSAELSALKNGTAGVFVSNGDDYPLDLTGSARAINEAWRRCERDWAREHAPAPQAAPEPVEAPTQSNWMSI
jgi:hypothetical protein